eukprot:TRINITY_DN7724_c0_g1_i2.p1 TRINITY_DN7724_c0_g1~~TRINITY_DN7724_c0_g1_i2.p1  ORF type:complete len:292 (-),score=74.61 TRINITY_DN7724_c0_g1_i2:41-916(-)
MPNAKNITFEELSTHFHKPINQVAKELGICATILKKICRRNGISRWPHRKIKSIDKMMENLSSYLGKHPEEGEDIQREIKQLQSRKSEILNNPDHGKAKSKRRKPKSEPYASKKEKKGSDSESEEELEKNLLFLGSNENSISTSASVASNSSSNIYYSLPSPHASSAPLSRSASQTPSTGSTSESCFAPIDKTHFVPNCERQNSPPSHQFSSANPTGFPNSSLSSSSVAPFSILMSNFFDRPPITILPPPFPSTKSSPFPSIFFGEPNRIPQFLLILLLRSSLFHPHVQLL